MTFTFANLQPLDHGSADVWKTDQLAESALGDPSELALPFDHARLDAREPIKEATQSLPSGLVRLPSSPPDSSPTPLYRVEAPIADTGSSAFFFQNQSPINSVVLSGKSFDSSWPAIAAAFIKANPDVKFLVATKEKFTSVSDPAYEQEQKRIAAILRVPSESVLPYRGEAPAFTRDDFIAGPQGIVKQSGLVSAFERIKDQRTDLGPNQIADALGLPTLKSPWIARGGDTQFWQDADGRPFAFFGTETIVMAAKSHGLDPTNDKDRIRALGIVMRAYREMGIDRSIPLGYPSPELADAKSLAEIVDRIPAGELTSQLSQKLSNQFIKENIPISGLTLGEMYETLSEQVRARLFGPDFDQDLLAKRDQAREGARADTIGGVLRQMTQEELNAIDPESLKELQSMANLPNPRNSFVYHSDRLVLPSADGKSMLVSADHAGSPPLRAMLGHFGFRVGELPFQEIVSPKLAEARLKRGEEPGSVNGALLGDSPSYVSYANTVTGLDPQGRTVALMPTEAVDPAQLTVNDERAAKVLRDAGYIVIPIGGRTAVIAGSEGAMFSDGPSWTEKDYGPRCMTNSLPYRIEVAD